MSLESQSFQKNNCNRLDSLNSFLEDRSVMFKMLKSIDKEMVKSPMDTEGTSVSEAMARFDYTGIYRLSMIYDESSLQISQHNIISVGGFMAFHPISCDDYLVILDIGHNNDQVLQGNIVVAPCLDYVANSIDHEECPYDDVIAVQDLTWIKKGRETEMEIDQNDASLSTLMATLPDVEEQHRLEATIISILSKCDMVRFVGEILVLEGPNGAIECMAHA